MKHMRTPWFLNLVLLVVTTFAMSGVVHAAKSGELPLVPQLTRELDLVLKAGDGLHKSLMQQNDEQIELSLRDMIVQLDHARSASALAKPHERQHLLRILDSAREQFELTQTAFGQERLARLEDAFNQLVNLIRIYRVDRAYAIYFCPKDKTTWIQRGAKAQNPFHPIAQREPCGLRVPR